jgi:ABC-type sugar transport system substrate-binding protein
MREVGLAEMKLANGVEVVISEEVTAAITEERRAAAHAWLREHDFGGLIKTVVTVPFGRGEEEEARRLAAAIAEEHACELKEAIHPQTLKAFVKEQVEAGKPLPFELFGVFPFSRAKVKMPKGQK